MVFLRRSPVSTLGDRSLPLLLSLSIVTSGPLVAQDPRYLATQFECARFHESSRSEARTGSGSHSATTRTGREASLIFRGRPGEGGVLLQAWFDSLTVWKETEGERTSPDTDGLLGGRYRGRLTAFGAYQSEERPFIPDEIAEATDVSEVPAEVLPPLPAAPLRVGQAWSDSTGWRITRVSDSTGQGRPLGRYRLSGRRERREARSLTDSLVIEVRQTEEETGGMVWDPARGLLRWERHVVSQSVVPAGGPIGQPIKARVEQRISVLRLPDRAGNDSTCAEEIPR
jgi:hypothetical protein